MKKHKKSKQEKAEQYFLGSLSKKTEEQTLYLMKTFQSF